MHRQKIRFRPAKDKTMLATPLVVALVVMISIVGLSLTPQSPAATTVVVPNKIVGAYLEHWIATQPSELPAGNNLLFSAFATINANGSVSYQPSQNVAKLKADIAARNAAGKPTILSIGGAGGAKSGLGSAAAQQAFLNSVKPIINEYGFSGIDWDIEQGVSISVEGLAKVSRSLVADYGANFAITMAPYDVVEEPYKQLAISIRDILTFVGFQFYNGDAAPTSASVLNKLDTWIRDTGIAPSQFTLGFMPKDDSGKVTSYTTMASIYEAVEAKYPTIRGAWTWAVEVDKASGWKFVSIMVPAVGAPTTPDPPSPPAKIGDLNGDNKVDLQDLSRLLTNYGRTGVGAVNGDVDRSGKVDLQDLSMLLSGYNK